MNCICTAVEVSKTERECGRAGKTGSAFSLLNKLPSFGAGFADRATGMAFHSANDSDLSDHFVDVET